MKKVRQQYRRLEDERRAGTMRRKIEEDNCREYNRSTWKGSEEWAKQKDEQHIRYGPDLI